MASAEVNDAAMNHVGEASPEDKAEEPKEDEGETSQALAILRPTTVEGLIALSKEHGVKGEHEEAVQAAEEALVLARDANDNPGQVTALCTLTQAQCRSGCTTLAIETAKRMRTLCHKLRERQGEAQALIEISHAHKMEHEARFALRAASAAAKLTAQNEMPAQVRIASLLALGDSAHQLLGDFAKAPVVDSRLQREIDNAVIMANTASEEALKLIDESDSFIQRAQTKHLRARTMMLFTGKEQAALEAASQARYMFNKAKKEVQEAEALLVLAQAYDKIEAKSQWAANALHDALEIFARLKHDEGKDQTYQLFQQLGIPLRIAGGMRPAGGGVPAIEGGGGGSPTGGSPAAAASQAVAKQKGLDPDMVMSAVQEMAKAAIGLDDDLFLDSPLMDSGMDSLTAVSFRNSLQQNLSVKLPSSLMFDYPTMKEVANRIVEISLEDE